MPRMPAMDAAVKILEDEGVDFVFGIPGSNVNAFYDSLSRSKKIKHLIARHEEGASHAADGWARASGKVGVCVGTSGPAGTNFITGLYAAQADSIPIIAITGQHVRAMEGKEGFQAMDISVVARPVCKKTYYVRDPQQIPWVFREAFRICREGRPGPVLIDLPIDVQRGECYFEPEMDSALPTLTPTPDPRRIERAVHMLLEAENPVLLMGGGCIISGATDAFIALAGPIATMRCESQRKVLAVDLDDTTSAFARFAGGATGCLSTLTATGRSLRLQVFGTRGWLHLLDHRILEICDIEGKVRRIEYPRLDIERAELEAFADAVAGRAAYPVPVEEAIHGVAVMQAAIRSAASGGERVAVNGAAPSPPG